MFTVEPPRVVKHPASDVVSVPEGETAMLRSALNTQIRRQRFSKVHTGLVFVCTLENLSLLHRENHMS